MLGVSGSAIKISGKKGVAGATGAQNAGPKPSVKVKILRSPQAASPVVKQRGSPPSPSPPPKSIKKKASSPVAALAIEKVPTILEQAHAELEAPSRPETSGTCIVAFNHYRKKFPVYNGVLKWADVDAEYSFSYVYKGAYVRNLLLITDPDILGRETASTSSTSASVQSSCSSDSAAAGDPRPPSPAYALKDEAGDLFVNLLPGKHYLAVVEESAEGIGAAGLRLNRGPLLAARQDAAHAHAHAHAPRAGNAAVAGITQELLSMNVKDLHSEHAQRLREARDLEDVLFS